MAANFLIFDKSKSPNNSKEFANWFDEKSKWKENRDYTSTVGTSKNLVDFFAEMKKKLTTEEWEELDCSIGAEFIYMDIPYSISDKVWDNMEALSEKYNLGYSDMVNIYWDKSNVVKYELPDRIACELKKQAKKEKFIDILGDFVYVFLVWGIILLCILYCLYIFVQVIWCLFN